MNDAVLMVVVGVLGFVAVAGLGFAFAGGDGGQARTARRIQALGGATKEKSRSRLPPAEAASQRRKQILETLKAQERQQRKTRHTVESRLRQSGLAVGVRQFWIFCVGLGVVAGALPLLLGLSPLLAMGIAFGAGLGLPRWVLGALIAKRTKKFTEEFPNAVDIIVRGIKSGLPVHDCLRLIGQECAETVAAEFRRLVESLAVGMSVDQGLEKMFERMPTPEVRFFAIVMAIQQKTGGNLAEALSGLSSVLRARKLMREKVKAMSGEAVASAFIIGSLPPAIMILVSVTAPTYLLPLFQDPRGHLMLLGAGVWMLTGILVMRRMINFKI